MKKQYTLWLSSWYPTALSPFDGDFIQRHAKAVSLYDKIVVVYIKKDVEGLVTQKQKLITIENNNLTEHILYYRPLSTGIKPIDKIISFFTYQILYYRTVKNIIKQNGLPQLIHVHIIKHIALLCLLLKRKFKLPIIISEQWTGFLQEQKSAFKKINPFYKWLWKRAFNCANEVTVVSDVLGKSIQTHFGITKYTVVQNVVDTSIFYPDDHREKVSSFVHISNAFEQKNIPKTLQAFGIVKQSGIDFLLHLFCPVKTELIQLIDKLGLKENVVLHGEVPQTELAKCLQKSDALILFSDYETFGCVVIEANAVGVPAILSDLPVFKEFCIENQTCLFAQKGNEKDLAKTLKLFIENKQSFNREVIATRTKDLYSFEVIGRQFHSIYETLS